MNPAFIVASSWEARIWLMQLVFVQIQFDHSTAPKLTDLGIDASAVGPVIVLDAPNPGAREKAPMDSERRCYPRLYWDETITRFTCNVVTVQCERCERGC
jgi:hypothetical protein